MPDETSASNKRFVRTLYEDAINGRRPELLAELISEDFVDDQGRSGASAFAANLDSLLAGFPDITFTVEDLIAEGDRVAIRWTCVGTHTGTFRTWRATGRRVKNSGIVIYQLRQGKILQASLETDRLGVLQQIGTISEDLVPSGPPVAR